MVLQPEFNVAQHESGINILYSYKSMFENFGHVVKKIWGLIKSGFIH